MTRLRTIGQTEPRITPDTTGGSCRETVRHDSPIGQRTGPESAKGSNGMKARARQTWSRARREAVNTQSERVEHHRELRQRFKAGALILAWPTSYPDRTTAQTCLHHVSSAFPRQCLQKHSPGLKFNSCILKKDVAKQPAAPRRYAPNPRSLSGSLVNGVKLGDREGKEVEITS